MGVDRRRFGLDTNVLIYAVEAGGGAKARQAEAMVRQAVATRRCVLAIQNIGKFYAACVRKRHAAPAAAAARAADLANLFTTVAAGIDEVRLALAEAAGGRFSYWDALLLATLGRAGCTVLLSEDMADGAQLGGITVRNPFVDGAPQTDIEALLAS